MHKCQGMTVNIIKVSIHTVSPGAIQVRRIFSTLKATAIDRLIDAGRGHHQYGLTYFIRYSLKAL